MSHSETIEQVSARILEARRTHTHFAAASVAAPESAADAYAVQDRVWNALVPGVRPSVWKVGAESRHTVPTAAPILPAGVHRSPCRLPARTLGLIAVELEFAYRFERDLPPRMTPYTDEEVYAAISSVHAAIEIVDTRIEDWRDAPPLLKLADFGLHGAFILGDGTTDWRFVDPLQQDAVLTINGIERERAKGSHAIGNPTVLLPWFAAHMCARVGSVRAGDIVTTGSLTRFIQATPGDVVVAELPGVGSARLEITA